MEGMALALCRVNIAHLFQLFIIVHYFPVMSNIMKNGNCQIWQHSPSQQTCPLEHRPSSNRQP